MIPVPLDNFPSEAITLNPAQDGFKIDVEDESGYFEMEAGDSEDLDNE